MLDVRTYRKRALPIRAVQVTADNIGDVAAWCSGRVLSDAGLPVVYVDGSVHPARVGDWVIESAETDRHYPMTCVLFDVAYELASVCARCGT